MNDDNSQSDEELIQELAGTGEQEKVPVTDKFIQNNPFLKPGTASYQNIQTQSMIKSSREEAGEQLAAIDAQNAAMLRQQKIAEGVTKAKHTGVYIAVGILFAAVLGAAIWLTVAAITAGRQTIAPSSQQGKDEKTVYGEVDGYKCTTSTCEKVTSIDSKRFIVHDGAQFYIFDMSSKKKTNTTIPEREYHTMNPFKWGSKEYVVLDPESGKSALYSLSSNLVLTEFSYDDFYTDIKNAIYKDMTWVEGSYIIAKTGSGYRLVDTASGKEIVRGAKRVFIREGYTFGYETDGTIRVYNLEGSNIVVVEQTDLAFVRNNELVVVATKEDNFEVYGTDGERADESPIYTEITNKVHENYAKYLKGNKSYFQIPVNN